MYISIYILCKGCVLWYLCNGVSVVGPQLVEGGVNSRQGDQPVLIGPDVQTEVFLWFVDSTLIRHIGLTHTHTTLVCVCVCVCMGMFVCVCMCVPEAH